MRHLAYAARAAIPLSAKDIVTVLTAKKSVITDTSTISDTNTDSNANASVVNISNQHTIKDAR